ncbi:hypothetical protein AjGTCBM29_02196 [Aeromonas jandaei]|nr:hypothetical protein AjGTCBM29_02196 [Aeromonas jandaei]
MWDQDCRYPKLSGYPMSLMVKPSAHVMANLEMCIRLGAMAASAKHHPTKIANSSSKRCLLGSKESSNERAQYNH